MLIGFSFDDSFNYKIGYYNNYDETSFAEMIDNVENFDLITHWITSDLRPDRKDEKWLNVLLKND